MYLLRTPVSAISATLGRFSSSSSIVTYTAVNHSITNNSNKNQLRIQVETVLCAVSSPLPPPPHISCNSTPMLPVVSRTPIKTKATSAPKFASFICRESFLVPVSCLSGSLGPGLGYAEPNF